MHTRSTISRSVLTLVLLALLSGCGVSSAAEAPSVPASVATNVPAPTPTAPASATPATASATETPPPAPPTPAPAATLPAATTDTVVLPLQVQPSDVPLFGYRVVNSYPHDPGAFTQGLIYQDGVLYEGTGLNGQSTLRKVELATGVVLQRIDLPAQYFGEGITVFTDTLIQLTWRTQRGFVYDKTSFARLGEFAYPTEGWGITSDGTQLIMSDGTATLYFLDPATFQQIGTLEVADSNGPVTRLNELEYVDGAILANVWQTDRVARIDPQSGRVTAWIDLTGLLGPEDRTQPVDVLNGIAYDAASKRLFVTGKLWPKLFEIELTPAL